MPETRLARGSKKRSGLFRAFAACLVAAALPIVSHPARGTEPRQVGPTDGPSCREPGAVQPANSLQAAVMGAVNAEAAAGKTPLAGEFVVLNGRGYNYAPPLDRPLAPPSPPER